MKASGTPLIVRVAGLPAESLAPLLSNDFEDRVTRLERLEAELDALRKALVELLFRAIHGADAENRRFLLEVKRDSFNGRTLRRHREAPEWPVIRALSGTLADRIVSLEETREAWAAEFAHAYQTCRDAQRFELAQLANQPQLRRGIALGSVVLVGNLSRLQRRPPAQWGRREKNVAEGFLRYVSRTTSKLSPFSSLTPVGLAATAEEPATNGLFLDSAWQERSFVTIRRFLLDQHADLLLRYGPFRQQLPVVLNDTAELLDDGKTRYLRAAVWEYDPVKNELESVPPALVKVRLAGPIARWVQEHLSGSSPTYEVLLTQLTASFPDEPDEALRATVDKLLEIGFLRFVLPWKSGDLHLESTFLEALQARPACPALAPYCESLADLLAKLAAFGTTHQPVEVVETSQELICEMLRRLARAVAVDPEVSFKGTQRYIHEDVFLTRPEGQEVVRLARWRALELLQDISPLARISNLDNGRYDFLYSLQAFARQNFPGRSFIPVLDLFDAGQKLFKAYVQSEVAARAHPPLKAPVFNPFELTVIAEAAEWRKRVASTMPEFLAERESELWLDGPALESLLDEVPGPYAAPRDFCAFVQPIDPGGDIWVLNSLFEGAGRMSSRYTPAMDSETRGRWTGHYTALSRVTTPRGSAELVDIYCPAGHTLNVHAPQTHRLLEIPGESSGVAPERRLRLRDLRVRVGDLSEWPRLVDAEGREIQPVHLGGLVFRHIPYLLKFLVTFGPGEFRYCIPRRPLERQHDADYTARHRCGSVVFRRRSWVVDSIQLSGLVAGRSEADTLYQLNRWRRERGIPRQVFVVEPLETVSARPQTKPQFVDFGSPIFLPILLSILDLKLQRLTLLEALPTSDNFPRAPGGDHRALEIQLDSFAFLEVAASDWPPRRSSPVGDRRERSERKTS